MRREELPGGPVITGFSGSGFRLRDLVYPRGLMLTPVVAIDWEAPSGVEALDIAMLHPVLHLDPVPEFLLMGTGAQLTRPAMALVRAIEALGIGVEAMDSRAAARAWGVLRQEGRQISAALLPLI